MNVLYHASNNSDLDILEPQRTLSKNEYIGDFVFATADKILAAMYLIPKGYGSLMESNSKPPKILVCGDESEIRSKDKGGAIYILDASDFTESPQKELQDFEMAADSSVRPIAKEVFDSTFGAWKTMGIEVKFIDQKTFNRLSKK